MSQPQPPPRHAAFEQALALYRQGQLPAALQRARQGLTQQPDHAALARVAAAAGGGSAAAHAALGDLLRQWGRREEAEVAYRRALALEPHDPRRHNNLAVLLKEDGRLEEAEAAIRRALELHPEYPGAHYNLGNLLHRRGRLAEAAAAFHRALELRPAYADAWYNLGAVLKESGRLEEAEAAYRQVLALRPQAAQAHNDLGNLLLERARPLEAEAAYRRALALWPAYAEAHYNLGNLLKDSGRLEEALAAYGRAVELRPEWPEAVAQWLHRRRHACDWRDLERLDARLRAFVHARGGGVPPFIFLAQPSSPAEQLACARQRAARLTAAVDAPAPVFAPRHRQRIRLGYLSADFHTHATAYLIVELFERHDRHAFEVVGYSYGPDDASALRERLRRACDRFVDLRALAPAQAAAQIRADEVDILIDLKGYTQGARPAILAQRPAPVQVAYLGYPGTLGAPFIDYLIADGFVVPAGHEAFYSEALVRLPDCYQPNDTQRAIAGHTPSRAECGLPDTGLVFCCFNNSYKITPEFFAIWMRLLAQTPGSVLWLLEANPLARANLRRAAQARGVDPARLVFAPRAPLPEHLARHRLADLFLDTLPVNAHTTASDALWAGLPVLTCAGATFAGRVCGSLLGAVGLPELVTDSPAAYEALALRLAHQPGLLARLRARLAANRSRAPLFDSARLTRHLEAAYRQMWQRHCAGEAPAPFAVPGPFEEALALYRQGRLEPALRRAEQALAAQPDHADLLNVAAAAARGLGRVAEAERYWRAAVAVRPGFADAHLNLGNLLRTGARPQEAEAAYRRAIALRPGYAAAHNELGMLLCACGRPEEAAAAYRRALELRPDHAVALYNLGNLLHQSGRLAEAEAAYRRVLAIHPRSSEAHNNLGLLLRECGRPEEAAAACRQAVAVGPRNIEAYNNLGNLLKELGHLEEAEAVYRRALAIEPRHADTHYNLGILLGVRGHLEEAEAAFRQVLAVDPQYVEARWNLGLLLLFLGRFAEGWPLYEVRLDPRNKEPVVRLPTLPFPRWQGQPLAGKSLLVLPEQGYGDQIQFCRYLTWLKGQGAARIDLACDDNLAALFASVAGVDAVVAYSPDDTYGAYDYWTFPLSIPLYCATIPAELPYLHTLPERGERWRERLPPDGLRVGLVWRGNTRHRNDQNRSLPGLHTLAPLWAVPGVTCVSLQKGAGEQEGEAPPAWQPLLHLGSAIADFADAAAVVSALDLVICVDTAIAHLAGALGKRCWVLLAHEGGSDWRWLSGRDDSPWYPGVMRLFRQTRPGDWAGVVARVAEALRREKQDFGC